MKLDKVFFEERSCRKSKGTKRTHVGRPENVTSGFTVSVQVRLSDSIVIARLTEILLYTYWMEKKEERKDEVTMCL